MSSCLDTEGSVLEVTSSFLSCSGMLILVLLAKERAVKVVKAGFVQVWTEVRDARDVRVRLVENIIRETERNCLKVFLCTWSCSYLPSANKSWRYHASLHVPLRRTACAHSELRVTRLMCWAGVYQSHDARMLRVGCAVQCIERRLDPFVGLRMRASEIVEIVLYCSAGLPSCL